ncbi:cytochrome P460 [Salinarimonas soli]|uniref:Cytochrome P460 n=2 Tax=Salinarimonas soli TaxID=1638099 RepID=A0A5B2VB60_9HYPH|nr:cytochrome P460 [Salinarimonas soli]
MPDIPAFHRHLAVLPVGLAVLAGLAIASVSASERAQDDTTPRAAMTLPAEYRDWSLIAVAREEGKLDDVRAILGNAAAIQAARTGTLPYPDGSIIVRLAWSFDRLPESEQAFGQLQSFTSGHPKNGVQVMVKDTVRFAESEGWGYAQFNEGRIANEAVNGTCLPCHQIVKNRDFVFNRYAR